MAEATTPTERRGLPNRLVHLVETGCSVVIISSLAYGTRTRLHVFLQQPLIRFFGMISFSFYLIHYPVLVVLENLVIITHAGHVLHAPEE